MPARTSISSPVSIAARYGRSDRRGRAYPSVPETRRDLDDRGADGGRHAATEPEPGRTPFLRWFDHDLPAHLTGTRSWCGARRPGGRKETARGDPQWRLLDGAPGCGNAV